MSRGFIVIASKCVIKTLPGNQLLLTTSLTHYLPATTSTYYPLQAEETAENLVRGNELLDSAAKHSRDFRLLVLA